MTTHPQMEPHANGVIMIVNKGQDIVETSYWDTAMSHSGYAYASWNAGALRLLIPDQLLPAVEEMRTGRQAIVTRCLLAGREAIEILFDDGSDAPYALHLTEQACDRRLSLEDEGLEIVVSAWGRSGKLAQWPGLCRAAARLPCLFPWWDVQNPA